MNIPQFQGNTVEEKITSMRAYFESKFTDEYPQWRNIIDIMNDHLVESLRKHDLPLDVVEPFTYDEFCAKYIEYLAQNMALNGGVYNEQEIQRIVDCMTIERMPGWVVDVLSRKAIEKRNARRLLEEPPEEAWVAPEHAPDTYYPDRKAAAPESRGPEYIPEIWSVRLGYVDYAFNIDSFNLGPEEGAGAAEEPA